MRSLSALVLAGLLTAAALPAAAPRRVPAALPFTTAWTKDFDGTWPVSAAVTGGADRIVLGWKDRVEVLSLADGARQVTIAVGASMLGCGPIICVAADDTMLAGIDPVKGLPIWRQPLTTALAQPPVLRGGWVLAADADGTLRAVSDVDGRQIWTAALRQPLTGPPTIDGDKVAVATADHRVHLLDLRSGVTSKTFVSDAALGAPRLGGGHVMVGTEARQMLVLSADTLKLSFAPLRTGGVVTGAPALDDDYIYSVAQDGVLRAFDRINGAQRWYSDLDTRAAAGPVTAGGAVLVPMRTGALAVLTAEGQPAGRLAPTSTETTVQLAMAPIVAGSGAGTRCITLSYDINNLQHWRATVFRGGASLSLSEAPASAPPGLALTLTPPR